MADMCTCMITGRLTADSELVYTNNSTPLLKFSVAVGRYERGETKTSFFDVVQWGKAAEALSNRLVKGSPVVVRGEMRQEFWNTDGSRRSKWVLNADAFGVQPLSNGQGGGQGGYDQGGGSYQGGYNNQSGGGYQSGYGGGQQYDPIDDDEIPF